MSYAYLFKYIIMGDIGVGKSSLLLRFTQNRFEAEHNFTFGVDLGARILTIDKTPIKLRIWDTGGHAKIRSIARSYSKDAIAALLVYDITRRETFYKIRSWLKDARQQGNTIMSIILVGNKCDVCRKREVSEEEGEQFAKENELLFIETSSKTSHNVDEAFIQTASMIYNKIMDDSHQVSKESRGTKVGSGKFSKPSMRRDSATSQDRNWFKGHFSDLKLTNFFKN